jgi:hypothetical protein
MEQPWISQTCHGDDSLTPPVRTTKSTDQAFDPHEQPPVNVRALHLLEELSDQFL